MRKRYMRTKKWVDINPDVGTKVYFWNNVMRVISITIKGLFSYFFGEGEKLNKLCIPYISRATGDKILMRSSRTFIEIFQPSSIYVQLFILQLLEL